MTNEEIAQIAALIAATLSRRQEADTNDKITRLTGIVETLAASVVAHDHQIEALIRISEENARNWEQLRREWQAYFNTLPKH